MVSGCVTEIVLVMIYSSVECVEMFSRVEILDDWTYSQRGVRVAVRELNDGGLGRGKTRRASYIFPAVYVLNFGLLFLGITG